jgi:hypothetical protein
MNLEQIEVRYGEYVTTATGETGAGHGCPGY